MILAIGLGVGAVLLCTCVLVVKRRRGARG